MQSMTIPILLCTVKFIFQTNIFLGVPQQVIIILCKKCGMNYRFFAYEELYLLCFCEPNTHCGREFTLEPAQEFKSSRVRFDLGLKQFYT